MKISLWLLSLLLIGSLHADTNSVWQSSYTNAVELAREKQRPVLLKFHASWCGPCKMMERTTFKDASVLEAMGNFIPVSLDFDGEPELAKKYGIESIPAFVVLNTDGDEVLKTTGFQDARVFREWLTRSMAAAAFSVVQKEMFQKQCREMETALASVDPVIKEKGVSVLFRFCSSKERRYREFAMEKLKTLSEAEAPLLVEGLNHPGLATRIHVTNLLRQKFGDAFEFDPWETAVAREKALAEWKAKLSARNPEPQIP